LVAADGTAGARVPAHAGARRLIAAAGGALAVTSANRSGEAPALSAVDAIERLGPAVDLILDGGSSPGGIASTVVVVGNDGPRIVREGPISLQEIEVAWREALAATGDQADHRA
jgi:L-threonylcarbamoyladenylate synthase